MIFRHVLLNINRRTVSCVLTLGWSERLGETHCYNKASRNGVEMVVLPKSTYAPVRWYGWFGTFPNAEAIHLLGNSTWIDILTWLRVDVSCADFG